MQKKIKSLNVFKIVDTCEREGLYSPKEAFFLRLKLAFLQVGIVIVLLIGFYSFYFKDDKMPLIFNVILIFIFIVTFWIRIRYKIKK